MPLSDWSKSSYDVILAVDAILDLSSFVSGFQWYVVMFYRNSCVIFAGFPQMLLECRLLISLWLVLNVGSYLSERS